ncbi:MAG: phage tail protein [Bacteroidales bacterium]|nr:phage tail protein [Bacteroidales bacterium]
MKKVKFLSILLIATLCLGFSACGGGDDEPDPVIIYVNNDSSSSDDEDDSTEALQIVGTWKTSYYFTSSGITSTWVMEVRENGSLSFVETKDSGNDAGSTYGSGTWTYEGNNIWRCATTYSMLTGEYNLFSGQLIHTDTFYGGYITYTLVWDRLE